MGIGLGEDLERLLNKKKLESKAPAYRRGLSLDITGRRIKVWDPLPPITSLHLSIAPTNIAFEFSPSPILCIH